MTKQEKLLRIRILNNMFSCQVKAKRSFFPNMNDAEYSRVKSSKGYSIVWKGECFSSHFIESVINQVVKFEKGAN